MLPIGYLFDSDDGKKIRLQIILIIYTHVELILFVKFDYLTSSIKFIVMVPSATTDKTLSTLAITSKRDGPPTLYSAIDQDEYQRKSDKYLLNYGTKFHKDVITGARGLYVYTASGHRVLDWTSGQMSCLLGHGHDEIIKVISDHAMYLDHLFSGMVSPPVIALGERLCEALPAGLNKAFFLSRKSVV